MVDEEAFLEHAEVFGHRYGTSRRVVTEGLAHGHDVVLEIDWQGAQLIRQEYPEALDIFILPPSRAELAARLKARGEDNPKVIACRMNQAQSEISHYNDYQHLVVNENFETALSEMTVIVETARSGRRLPRKNLQTLLDELLIGN